MRLTPDVAVRLESVLGIPAQFWNNLEAIYQEKLIKAKEENDLDEDIELAKHFPYSEMANHGWVPKATRVQDKVMNLRKFFEVARLPFLESQPVLGIARRQPAGQHRTADNKNAVPVQAERAELKDDWTHDKASLVPPFTLLLLRVIHQAGLLLTWRFEGTFPGRRQ